MKTLNLIGAGRVGQTLAALWHGHASFAIQDVLTTSLASAQNACAFMGAGTPVADMAAMRPADVWMIAVQDAHIASVAHALAHHRHLLPAMAFHCSGALGSAALAPLEAVGWSVASAHCILSFASAPAALAQFAGTPCALEGNALACDTLRPALGDIGAQCFAVASEHKLLYHAAAVFATNFLPVLQAVAEDAWRATGVPESLLPGLRASLLKNAVANNTALGPAGALTGPAARGDVAAIARQAQAVTAWDPQAGAAYEAMSALALRLSGTHRR
jgi:predicted short-subunit dehydrogenase-like oxidoreductase (DUF2520 family)